MLTLGDLEPGGMERVRPVGGLLTFARDVWDDVGAQIEAREFMDEHLPEYQGEADDLLSKGDLRRAMDVLGSLANQPGAVGAVSRGAHANLSLVLEEMDRQ
jgi:hypothetical protein